MTAKSDNRQFIAMNRSGVMTAPELSRELIQGAQAGKPTSAGDAGALTEALTAYANAQGQFGSLPSVQATSGADAAKVSATALLLDLLGDRLAFERGGTRLYEALIRKAQLSGVKADIMKDLQHIYSEELEHFILLQGIITQMGGDATVQTPAADVSGVIAHGVMQVVADPRTSFVQSLQAILSAELTDNDGWQMLTEFFIAQGYKEFAQQCTKALEEEQEHLLKVRTWIKALLAADASPPGTRHSCTG